MDYKATAIVIVLVIALAFAATAIQQVVYAPPPRAIDPGPPDDVCDRLTSDRNDNNDRPCMARR
jgi:hypothetical protein